MNQRPNNFPYQPPENGCKLISIQEIEREMVRHEKALSGGQDHAVRKTNKAVLLKPHEAFG